MKVDWPITDNFRYLQCKVERFFHRYNNKGGGVIIIIILIEIIIIKREGMAENKYQVH